MTLPRRSRPRRRLGRGATSHASASCRSRRSVEPGEVRAQLPDAPPEHGEPFEAMLRDLDELIVPGLTHWNHPRFFAWFANTGSEPGILAELLIAALNVNAMTWLASPAATELELTVLDWLAQLLGLPRGWHGHIEDTASTVDGRRARRRAHAPAGRRRLRVRAGELQRREGGAARRARVPDGRRSTTSSACAPTSRSTTRPRSSRRSARPATTSVDPVPRARAPLRGGGRVAARRRRVRRLGGGLPRAPLVPRRRATAPTRSSSTRTSGCSRRWTARRSGRGGPRCCTRRSPLVPDYLASTDGAVDLQGLRPGARPPLPRAEALVRAALVRRRGAAGADPRARPARAALRGVGRGRARLGGRRAASVLDRLLPARRAPTTTRSRARRPRRASCSSRRRALRGADDDPARDRQRARRPRTTFAARGRCCACVRAVIFDLWETLVDWDREAAAQHASHATSTRSSATGSRERWDAARRPRYTAPIRDGARRRRRAGRARSTDVLRAPARLRPPLPRAARRRGRDAARAARARLQASG